MNNLQFTTLTANRASVIFLIFLAKMPLIRIWLEEQLPLLKQRRKHPDQVNLFYEYRWHIVKTVIDTTKLIFK